MRGVLWGGLALAAVAGCGRFNFDPLSNGSGGADDASDGDGRAVDTASQLRFVFAATQTQLFQVDRTTLVPNLTMTMCGNLGGVQLGEIAMASTGALYGASVNTTGFFRIDRTTGNCTAIANLAVRLFGADFVPAGVVSSSETLLGAGDDDNLYRVDVATGALALIGPMGMSPSGDLAWSGTELFMSATSSSNDHLARVNVTTGLATDLGDTTHTGVLGLASLGGTLYAFGSQVAMVLDPSTGAPTQTVPTTQTWAGAAVGP